MPARRAIDYLGRYGGLESVKSLEVRAEREFKKRLAERTIERDDVAREVAVVELARTNAELIRRLAERTVERDDVARGEALAELARTNAELERRLTERTLERDAIAGHKAGVELLRTNLAEEQLQLHADELEALNEELESFSYSVSHDLRSPLRAVIGYTRALEEDYASRLDAEGLRLLSVVVSEASRMGDLIDDLLAFSRLGRTPMVTVAVDMTAMAREVAAEEARAAGASPTVVQVATLPVVYGDRALLRQVWVNLISNAIKYSSKNLEPHILVWATSGIDRVDFHVRDNGVGFDMSYASKLFGVFQRLHASAQFAGTGVGLAIVKRVIKRHGGVVWAESALGAGATFSFGLPNGSHG